MKAREFEKAFDAGEDVTEFLDLSKTRKLQDVTRRVNVDFPAWVVAGLDARAKHLGVTRQALIKLWIAERLE